MFGFFRRSSSGINRPRGLLSHTLTDVPNPFDADSLWAAPWWALSGRTRLRAFLLSNGQTFPGSRQTRYFAHIVIEIPRRVYEIDAYDNGSEAAYALVERLGTLYARVVGKNAWPEGECRISVRPHDRGAGLVTIHIGSSVYVPAWDAQPEARIEAEWVTADGETMPLTVQPMPVLKPEANRVDRISCCPGVHRDQPRLVMAFKAEDGPILLGGAPPDAGSGKMVIDLNTVRKAWQTSPVFESERAGDAGTLRIRLVRAGAENGSLHRTAAVNAAAVATPVFHADPVVVPLPQRPRVRAGEPCPPPAFLHPASLHPAPLHPVAVTGGTRAQPYLEAPPAATQRGDPGGATVVLPGLARAAARREPRRPTAGVPETTPSSGPVLVVTHLVLYRAEPNGAQGGGAWTLPLGDDGRPAPPAAAAAVMLHASGEWPSLLLRRPGEEKWREYAGVRDLPLPGGAVLEPPPPALAGHCLALLRLPVPVTCPVGAGRQRIRFGLLPDVLGGPDGAGDGLWGHAAHGQLHLKVKDGGAPLRLLSADGSPRGEVLPGQAGEGVLSAGEGFIAGGYRVLFQTGEE